MDDKGHPVMIIFTILVILLAIFFVFPAMEKGGDGPSSILDER